VRSVRKVTGPVGTVAKLSRDLSDLITLFGSADEIATVDIFGLAKWAGEIIARSGGNIQRQYEATGRAQKEYPSAAK